MKVYETDALRLTVQEGPVDGTWEVVIEVPGSKIPPMRALTGGAGPASEVAMDMLRQLSEIHRLGVSPYVKKTKAEFPDVDPEEVRKMASAFFKVADAVGGEPAIRELASQIIEIEVDPESRATIEEFQEAMVGKWDFGDVKIQVQPGQFTGPEIVGFIVDFIGPGGVTYKDLMQRPVGYLLARIAQEQVMIMRRTLEMGIDAAARHFLKANYLGLEYLPQMTQHATNIDRIARAIGDPELARLEGLLAAETEKESEARQLMKGKMEKVVERQQLKRLEDRERQLVRQIDALKKRRANPGK